MSQIIERDPTEPRSVNPRVPTDFETIVLKCLRKDAGDRYGTAEALGQDLRSFVRGDPIEAKLPTRWERVASRLRRHRARLSAAAAFVALAGTLVAIYVNGESAARTARLARYEPVVHEALALFGTGRFAAGKLSDDASRLVRKQGDHVNPFRSEDFSMFSGPSASLERAREFLERAGAVP